MKMVFAGSLVLVFSLAIGNAFGQVQYTVTDLGTLGGTSSGALDINNSGQVVGDAKTGVGTVDHALLWQSGSGMQDLGTFGGTNSIANGVNNSGQVVGNAYTSGDATFRAFLWQSGSEMLDLGTLGGQYAYALGINDSAQVVG